MRLNNAASNLGFEVVLKPSEKKAVVNGLPDKRVSFFTEMLWVKIKSSQTDPGINIMLDDKRR